MNSAAKDGMSNTCFSQRESKVKYNQSTKSEIVKNRVELNNLWTGNINGVVISPTYFKTNGVIATEKDTAKRMITMLLEELVVRVEGVVKSDNKWPKKSCCVVLGTDKCELCTNQKNLQKNPKKISNQN